MLDLTMSHNIKRLHYKVGFGRANGTFGELMQGILPNGQHFMVTFPVQLFSMVRFTPDHSTRKITAFPTHKVKSILFASNLLAKLKIEAGGQLTIESEIEEGKGLASSSADLVATAHAIGDAFNIKIDEELISSMIALVEPSDGVMYDEIVAFNHKQLQLIERIGYLPLLTIIGIDEGTSVDTISYNAKKKNYTQNCPEAYQLMLQKMINAIRRTDLVEIGRLSTQSAVMNQKNNPKKDLDIIIKIAIDNQALGVSVAHSGAFLGILLDPAQPGFDDQYMRCIEKVRTLNRRIKIFKSIDFNTRKLVMGED